MRGLISSSICITSSLLQPFLNGKNGGRGTFHFSPALLALLNFAHRMGLRRSVGGHLQIGLTDDIGFSDHLLCHQRQGPTTLLKVRIWVSVKSGMCLCLLWDVSVLAVVLPVWAQEKEKEKTWIFFKF